jgi:hypothetical protein
MSLATYGGLKIGASMMQLQPAALPGARVTINDHAATFGTGPLSLNLYDNSARSQLIQPPAYAKGQPIQNPFTLDAQGKINGGNGIWLPPGVYDVTHESPPGTVVHKWIVTVTEVPYTIVTGVQTWTAPDGTQRSQDIYGPSTIDCFLTLDMTVLL